MILWADGFDHYGMTMSNLSDGPYADVFGWELSTTRVRTGTHSLYYANAAGELRRVFGAAKDEVGVGMAIWRDALPSLANADALHQFRTAGNLSQVTLILQPTGALALYSLYNGPFAGSPGTLLGTSTALVTAGAWNHVECFVKIDAAVGAAEVRLNGVTVLNVAGVNTDTKATAETSIWASLGGNLRYIDDVVAWDTAGGVNDDFVGDKKVFTDFADADTADVGWTPSAGSTRWEMIDDVAPDADGSYVTSATPGQIFGVSFPDLPASIVAINTVILMHKSIKTDAGTANITVEAVSGAASDVGVDRPITTAYSLYSDAFDVDPNTSAPWTPAGVNAMSARVTRSA